MYHVYALILSIFKYRYRDRRLPPAPLNEMSRSSFVALRHCVTSGCCYCPLLVFIAPTSPILTIYRNVRILPMLSFCSFLSKNKNSRAVKEFHGPAAHLFIEEHVLRLEVPVDDTLGVQIAERRARLRRVKPRPRLRKHALLLQVVKQLPNRRGTRYDG